MRIGTLIKKLACALPFVAVMCTSVSCINNQIADIDSRTVLVYMAADNNLWQNATSNILAMKNSLHEGMYESHLIVFADITGKKPMLLEVTSRSVDTIKVYNDLDSTSPEVMRSITEYVTNIWKSDSYGLVLWSHGTGWIPEAYTKYALYDLGYRSQIRNTQADSSQLGSSYLGSEFDLESGRTKAFGRKDRTAGGRTTYTWMDIPDLASGLPDNVFDFILFDACYMASIEVLYQLRNKANYIISSCYEIWSDGMPYQNITLNMMRGKLFSVCQSYYDYYNSMVPDMRMAGISVVSTSGLDSLARCFSKIVSESADRIANYNISSIQTFDWFNNHLFFDLKDVADSLNTPYTAEFDSQLARCVPYSVSTAYIFPEDSRKSRPINRYCGISTYIPLVKYDTWGKSENGEGLNEAYRKLDWSIDTGY